MDTKLKKGCTRRTDRDRRDLGPTDLWDENMREGPVSYRSLAAKHVRGT